MANMDVPVYLDPGIRTNEIWTDPERLRSWIDLILLAEPEDGSVLRRGGVVEFKRGDVVASIRELATRWGWSRTKAIRFLDYCENRGMLKKKSHSKQHLSPLFAIINYDHYQKKEPQKSHKKATKKPPVKQGECSDPIQGELPLGPDDPKPAKTATSDIDAVAAAYRKYHPRWQCDEKSRKLIARQLKSYSVGELKAAIRGIHVSPFHCGDNESGKKYQALSLCLRDSSKVAEFIEISEGKGHAKSGVDSAEYEAYQKEQLNAVSSAGKATQIIKQMRKKGATDDQIRTELERHNLEWA